MCRTREGMRGVSHVVVTQDQDAVTTVSLYQSVTQSTAYSTTTTRRSGSRHTLNYTK